jgi:hypothetical protein
VLQVNGAGYVTNCDKKTERIEMRPLQIFARLTTDSQGGRGGAEGLEFYRRWRVNADEGSLKKEGCFQTIHDMGCV